MLRRNFRRTLVICVLAAGAACSSAGADESENRTGAAASADDAVASGVGVLALGCGASASAGSGVVVGVEGQVVTVAHTVAGATSIRVVDADGREYDARVVAFAPNADLAVLDVEDLAAPPLAVGEVRLGDGTLIRWSTDEGLTASRVEVTQRLAITIDDIYGNTSVERSGFEFAGNVVVGDSGGPIISPDGVVIGIVYARSSSRPRTAFATDAGEIDALLDAVGSEPVDNGTCV